MTKIIENTPELVSIGRLARDAGVTSRTIRYYEELGILPEPSRSAGGTRKYPREYGGYVSAAIALKELGFRLDEIKPLARLAAGRQLSPSQREAAARLVQERIDVLARQISTLRGLLDAARHALCSGRDLSRSARREAAMTDGLILLGFIAIVIAVVTARVRRRVGLPVRPGFYAAAAAVVAIAVLLLWVTQNH